MTDSLKGLRPIKILMNAEAKLVYTHFHVISGRSQGHWALWSTDDLGRGGDEEGRMQLPSPLQSHSSHSREWSSCLAPSSCEVSPWPQVWREVKLPRSLERSQRVPPSKAGQDTKGTEKHEAVAWGVSLTSGFSELFSDDFVDNKMWVKPSCFLTTMSLYL